MLTGNGESRLTRVVPWSLVLMAGAAVFAAIALATRFAVKAGRRQPQWEIALTERHPR